jgi:DNA recombination protein RmuC
MNLGVETSKLVKALQKPHVRGQWGEMALERVFEIAGLTEGRDFYSQQTIGGEDSIQRPDFIVCLPGNKHLAIDAKAPISAFLEAAEETDDAVKSEKLGKFVSHVRKRVKELGGKSYDQALDNSPEFVVLYLPTEAVVSAALELDKKLLEYAYEQRVLLAGPTIIISLLFAVAHGWKQEVVEKHAKDIHELGKELYSRLATFGGHIGKLQTHLRGSVTAYNAFVGSLESSVMPQARRFEDYKAAPADKQLLELKQIEVIPRQLQGSDFANVEIDGEIKDPALSARPR